MTVLRATEFWHFAAMSYVRVDTATEYFQVSLEKEFGDIDSLETTYFVAFDGIHPVATCRIHILDDKTVKIERVSVVTHRHGEGIGKILMQEAEKWIQEQGYQKIKITSREAVLGFYESLGYKTDYNSRIENGIFTTLLTEKNLREV